MWFLWAALTAVSHATTAFIKKRQLKYLNEYVLACGIHVLLALFLLPVVIFQGFEQLSPELWLVLLFSLGLVVSTSLLFLKSLKYGDLSKVVPLLSLTPIFLLFTSPIMVNEILRPLPILGVLLVVIGSYVLQLEDKTRLLQPFTSLWTSKAARYMLITAFLYSIAANLDKIAIQHTSILTWVFYLNAGSGLVLLPLALKNIKAFEYKSLYRVSYPAVAALLTMFFHLTALSEAFVAYVIAIKRTSGIFSVLLGSFFLHEKHIRTRLLGALVMTTGVVVILLA